MELQTSVQFDCRNQTAMQEMQLKALQIERKREDWRKKPPQTKNLSPFCRRLSSVTRSTRRQDVSLFTDPIFSLRNSKSFERA